MVIFESGSDFAAIVYRMNKDVINRNTFVFTHWPNLASRSAILIWQVQFWSNKPKWRDKREKNVFHTATNKSFLNKKKQMLP